MALSKSQERVGHLRSVSTNPTAKTGRDAGVRTPASGKTEHGKSSNPVSRKGSEPGRELERGYGPRTGRGDKAVPSPSSIGDGVVR